jgi:glucose uptake protein
MLCRGSWANTQKLASKDWRFQLFYWDFAIGVLLLALVLAFTLGSTGTQGRAFLPDIRQASGSALGSALLGGIVWSVGMSLSILASGVAGFAISYGLGQGATLVAALWGVFVWR